MKENCFLEKTTFMFKIHLFFKRFLKSIFVSKKLVVFFFEFTSLTVNYGLKSMNIVVVYVGLWYKDIIRFSVWRVTFVEKVFRLEMCLFYMYLMLYASHLSINLYRFGWQHLNSKIFRTVLILHLCYFTTVRQ